MRGTATTAEGMPATATGDVSELITAAKQNEEWAWRDLCAFYLERLERYASMQGAEDPAGIANTTLLEFHRSVDRFRGDSRRALDAYLYRTARNRIIDEHRKNRASTVPLITGEITPNTIAAAEFDEVIAGEEWVSGLLANLSDDQRKVLELRFMQDRSVNETAAILDKPPGTVNVIQHRALKALRLALAAALIAVAWIGVRQLTNGGERSISVEPADTSVPGQGLIGDVDTPVESPPDDVDGEGLLLDGPQARFEEVSDSEADQALSGEATPDLTADETTDSGDNTAPPQDSTAAVDDPSATEVSTTSPPSADQTASTQPSTNPPSTTRTPTTRTPTTQTQTTQPPTTEQQTTQRSTTQPPATQPATTGPAATQPQTTEPPTTQAPATQPSTTLAPSVATPYYCEVQLESSGVGTTGVEVHDLNQQFAERYVFYDQDRNFVWSGTDPQQVEGIEIEFEAIPSGFDPELVYYVAAQEGQNISPLRSCLRRS